MVHTDPNCPSLGVFFLATKGLDIFPNGTDDTTGEDETEHLQRQDTTGYPYHNSYPVVQPVFDRIPTRL